MTQDAKAIARRLAFAARKRAHGAAQTKTPSATAHLLAEIGPPRGRVIAGYWPIRTEIDPRPALAALHAGGAQIALPVIAEPGEPLMFRAWDPNSEMIEGPFGAKVPAEGGWCRPDTLIVPLVGFDADLARLGYGGGFYDRTLARLRAAGPTRAIGFAYAAQALEDLPQKPTDQRLDQVVTEDGPLVARAAGQ